MQKIHIIIYILCSIGLNAQYDHAPVLKGLEGDALFNALVQEYKPSNVLSNGNARDTMFGEIYTVEDSVHCVYSGYTKYLDPTADPTTFVYENGMSTSMNTEHAYPRSKGAEQEPGKSDLHHLFPTRSLVNSARGSFRFDEINDQQTNSWFRNLDQMNNIPGVNIDEYSEVDDDRFEPREDFKGNIARAMFYFYTMYRNQALNADPNFFESQKEVLCDWHFLDPVDEEEWNRSYKIGEYQDNKPNPFILDCSVAARLYCPESDIACKLVDTNDEAQQIDLIKVIVKPNPSNGSFTIRLNLDQESEMKLRIFDLSGKVVLYKQENVARGTRDINIKNEWPKGVYIYHITLKNSFGTDNFKNKIIIE